MASPQICGPLGLSIGKELSSLSVPRPARRSADTTCQLTVRGRQARGTVVQRAASGRRHCRILPTRFGASASPVRPLHGVAEGREQPLRPALHAFARMSWGGEKPFTRRVGAIPWVPVRTVIVS